MANKVKLQIIGSGAILTANASASTLVDDKILVDCGADTFKQLLRLNCNLEKINTILITHLHADHFMGVPFMMLAARKNNNGQKLTIFLPEGGIEATHEIAKYLWNPEDASETWWTQYVNLIEYQNGNSFVRDDIMITPVKAAHGKLKASGFILEKADIKIGFSGDSAMCDGIDKILEMTDCAILDASYLKSGDDAHMGLDNIYELCGRYPNKKIIPTHMFKDTRKAIRRDIANLMILNDGDIIEF